MAVGQTFFIIPSTYNHMVSWVAQIMCFSTHQLKWLSSRVISCHLSWDHKNWLDWGCLRGIGAVFQGAHCLSFISHFYCVLFFAHFQTHTEKAWWTKRKFGHPHKGSRLELTKALTMLSLPDLAQQLGGVGWPRMFTPCPMPANWAWSFNPVLNTLQQCPQHSPQLWVGLFMVSVNLYQWFISFHDFVVDAPQAQYWIIIWYNCVRTTESTVFIPKSSILKCVSLGGGWVSHTKTWLGALCFIIHCPNGWLVGFVPGQSPAELVSCDNCPQYAQFHANILSPQHSLPSCDPT